MKFSISPENFNLVIEIFNLVIENFNPDLQNPPQKMGVWWVARLKFSISLDNFNPDLQNPPQKMGVWWVACLKFTISLENFRVLKFFNLWALRAAFPADICGFLQKSAIFCGLLRMPEFPEEGVNQRQSAVVCENLRLGPGVSA